jgi:hypothetical protein
MKIQELIEEKAKPAKQGRKAVDLMGWPGRLVEGVARLFICTSSHGRGEM